MKYLYIITVALLCTLNNALAENPVWEWARSGGAIAIGGPQSICTDAQGNTYITGSFAGPSITFGSHTLINHSQANGNNIFIVKYDSSGNVLWANSAGGTNNDEGQNITMDASGNIYVSGFYGSQSIIFGNDTFTNGLPGISTDFFLAKYDANGNFYWATNKGLGSNTSSQTISVDAAGNVYATGSFTGAFATVGTDTIRNPHGQIGNSSIYAVKYNLTGNVAWVKAVQATSPNGVDYGQSISTDAFGNIYITGYFVDDTIRFGHDTLTGSGFVLLKYNQLGTPVWAKKAGGQGFVGENSQGISTDAQGNIFVTGEFPGGNMTFGSNTIINLHSSSGSTEIYLVKYDSTGHVAWAQGAGGTGYNISNRVSIDAAGNAYITGTFGSTSIDFDNTTLTTVNNSYPGGIFVVQYTAGGNVGWAKSAGGNALGYSTGISVDALGDVYITGYYAGPNITFGGATITDTVSGNTDFFVAKLGYHPVATGVGDLNNSSDNIKVYPNPSTGSIYFKDISTGSTIQIYNVLGEMIYSSVADNDNIYIHINSQSKGVYFYRVYKAEQSTSIQQGKIILE